jgi:hypothetical protein
MILRRRTSLRASHAQAKPRADSPAVVPSSEARQEPEPMQ